MPSPVRVGASPAVLRGRGVPPAQQGYPGTTSVYGSSRGDSVGANPKNPMAYSASQGAKAYPNKSKFDNQKTIKELIPDNETH